MAPSMRHGSPSTVFFSPSPLSPSLLPVVLALSLLLAACANPVAPSGGPRDTTPPAVVRSDPEDGEVNVDQESILITFSEHVDRSSLEEAVSMTPALDGNLNIDFGGDEARIHFPESLRENTTYILTLDKNLQDARNVSLDAPITIAFSTGPTINKGQLRGRVVTPETGAGQEDVDIYAYALQDSTEEAPPPDSLPERPAYRTQTDSDGEFHFEYLQEQPYFVIALEDENRNREPDPLEPYAVPPRPALMADSTETDPERAGDWVMTVRDTIPPSPARVQSYSQRRHEVRFDEPVRLAERNPADWQLEDSLNDRPRDVGMVYQRAGSPNLVFLRTEALEATSHRLLLPDSTVVDTSGNAVPHDTLRFTPSEEADTLRTRFVNFTPQDLSPDTADVYTLLPGVAPGVRFNQPLDSARFHTVVTARDADGNDYALTPSTSDGTTYRLRFEPALRSSDYVEVRVDGQPLAHADTVFARTFQRISNRELGELSGTVTFADTTDTLASAALSSATPPFVVEIYAEDASIPVPSRRTSTNAAGQFHFDNLPEGTFRFRAFLDRNGNGRWDGGQILPFQPAEPITWSEGTIDTRPRWENVLETPLRLPNP